LNSNYSRANLKLFDRFSSDYDESFKLNPLGVLSRSRLLRYAKKQIGNNPKRILDIGCGTGEDALELLRLGHMVDCLDFSVGMMSITKQKIIKAGFQRVNFIVSDLNSMNYVPDNKYDCIYSNGVINFLDDIDKLPAYFCKILKPGGLVFLTCLNKLCVREMMYYLVRLKPLKMLRRFQNKGISYQKGYNDIDCKLRYYDVSDFVQTIESKFEIIDIQPICVLLPLSYQRYYSLLTKYYIITDRVELSKYLPSIFRYFGESFIIYMKMK